MNYLAHIFLSGPDPEIITGNFIGDHVTGRHYEGFSPGIIKGIELHRAIDAFTDSHAIVEKSKSRLRPVFHKYAPVIVDIYYDHFLAVNWSRHAELSLLVYTKNAYALLNQRREIIPERAQRMLSYMEKQNWLYHYSTLDGIGQALTGMSRRATFESGMERAAAFLEEHYNLFADDFDLFFPDLKSYCNKFLSLPGI